MTMRDELINWLNGELHRRGWSQRELGRRAGISGAMVSKVLSGEKPGWDFCVAIARALEVTPEEVFRLARLLPHELGKDEEPDAETLLQEIHKAVVKEDPLTEAKARYLADDATTKELHEIVKGLTHQERVELLKFAYFLRNFREGEASDAGDVSDNIQE